MSKLHRWNQKIGDEELIFLRHLGFRIGEIARLKNMKYLSVQIRARKLVEEGYLTPSLFQRNPAKLIALSKVRAKKREDEVFKFLENRCGISQMEDHTSEVILRLIRTRRLFVVETRVNQGAGPYKRHLNEELFKPEFRDKRFICNNRTAIVRLFLMACNKPETWTLQLCLSRFLRKYLSDAEKLAVLWGLGIHNFSKSQLKQSIEIDGIYHAHQKYTKLKNV